MLEAHCHSKEQTEREPGLLFVYLFQNGIWGSLSWYQSFDCYNTFLPLLLVLMGQGSVPVEQISNQQVEMGLFEGIW